MMVLYDVLGEFQNVKAVFKISVNVVLNCRGSRVCDAAPQS